MICCCFFTAKFIREFLDFLVSHGNVFMVLNWSASYLYENFLPNQLFHTHSSWMKRIESIILCEVTGYDSAWCLDTSEGGKAFFFAFPTEIDISIFSSPYSFIRWSDLKNIYKYIFFGSRDKKAQTHKKIVRKLKYSKPQYIFLKQKLFVAFP